MTRDKGRIAATSWFRDPAHPDKVYMVFEGNTAVQRGARACTEADLGYVMPGGLVTSFIDAIGLRRGGAYAPTVRIRINESVSAINLGYGTGGLGGYGDIPANRALGWGPNQP